MSRLTDAEYEELADSYEKDLPGPDEIVGPIEVNPGQLKNGRPPKGTVSRGKTPTLSVRFPDEMRTEVDALAVAEGVKSGEIVRRAVAEYLERHPAS